ncbi:hypothetical protein EYF80_039936 [Liparis tanakae]|uniref:Secreted protein n=1 Tax=Liparis tanakae TaxID=230148 RepID=A0A4Z2GAR4_9TELE|nr:hypothetical protein EYF80_039936 [Liparis tanakae]
MQMTTTWYQMALLCFQLPAFLSSQSQRWQLRAMRSTRMYSDNTVLRVEAVIGDDRQQLPAPQLFAQKPINQPVQHAGLRPRFSQVPCRGGGKSRSNPTLISPDHQRTGPEGMLRLLAVPEKRRLGGSDGD